MTCVCPLKCIGGVHHGTCQFLGSLSVDAIAFFETKKEHTVLLTDRHLIVNGAYKCMWEKNFEEKNNGSCWVRVDV